MNYYKNELAKLGGQIKVKFESSDGDTRWLNINNESINEIIEFLNNQGIYTMQHPDGDMFIVNKWETANKGFIVVWDEIGGHSEASLEYIAECKKVNNSDLIELYNKLYK
ncbi:MAG: hypothetical protein RBR50_01000 [Candidatus Izemoplasmatales bacterium]|nr:hypothetical protein [Candidatus Izemoplasmatales bacterium]